MRKIILISGPPGVGKSFFAKKLLKKLESAFLIDSDVLSDEIKNTFGKKVFDEKWPINKLVINSIVNLSKENTKVEYLIIVHPIKKNNYLKLFKKNISGKIFLFELKTSETMHRRQIKNRKNRMSDYTKVLEYINESEILDIDDKYTIDLTNNINKNIKSVIKIVK